MIFKKKTIRKGANNTMEATAEMLATLEDRLDKISDRLNSCWDEVIGLNDMEKIDR